MLGHLSFGVSDLERSVAFYDPALAPLGLTRVWSFRQRYARARANRLVTDELFWPKDSARNLQWKQGHSLEKGSSSLR
jgi:catechol 2,3-dioxygenase-like lactoylglutathione lyase family enzyme